jgi:hypothetical protein
LVVIDPVVVVAVAFAAIAIVVTVVALKSGIYPDFCELG